MRTATIHQSTIRPALVLGAERDLVMFSGLIALLVGVGGFTLISAILGGIFWLVAVFVLRRMARVDPQLSKVWLRSIKYQTFYAAKSTPK